MNSGRTVGRLVFTPDPLLFGEGAAAEIRSDDLREWMVMSDYERLTRLSWQAAKAYNGHVRVASGAYRIGSEPRSPRTAIHLLGPSAPPRTPEKGGRVRHYVVPEIGGTIATIVHDVDGATGRFSWSYAENKP